MSQRSERGFTIIEILLAVVVLSVGVMALVGSSALATRMIGRGNKSSEVAQVALARAELLRAYAAQTSPGCTNAAVKSDSSTTATGIGEKWVLLGAAGDCHPGRADDVQLPRGRRHQGRHHDDHPLLQVTMTTRRGFTLVELHDRPDSDAGGRRPSPTSCW